MIQIEFNTAQMSELLKELGYFIHTQEMNSYTCGGHLQDDNISCTKEITFAFKENITRVPESKQLYTFCDPVYSDQEISEVFKREWFNFIKKLWISNK